ncbi:MAG: sugar transferase [Pseudanabaena sp. ELA607]
MILIAIGTGRYPFHALLDWVTLLMELGFIEEEIVLYSTADIAVPNFMRRYRNLSEAELKRLIGKARLVIGNCDEATTFLLEESGKPFVLVPRTNRLGEYTDEGQMELADTLEKQGLAIARSPGDLLKFLKLSQWVERFHLSPDESNLADWLSYMVQSQHLLMVSPSGGYFTYLYNLKDFWRNYSYRRWVTLDVPQTKAALSEEIVYWARPTTASRWVHLGQYMRLLFRVFSKEIPDVVISSGGGLAVPFLIAAKLVCRAKIIFIELRTRMQRLSFYAKILHILGVIDVLVVRSEALLEDYPKAEYIPTLSISEGEARCDYKSVVQLLCFDNLALLSTPERLDFSSVRRFQEDFHFVCNDDEVFSKVIVDLSRTIFIDSAGIGLLVTCAQEAKSRGTKLELWSVSDAVLSVLNMTALRDVFLINMKTQTARSHRWQNFETESQVNPILEALYKLHKPLKRNSFLKIFYYILKFFYPAIDINPRIRLHPSVRHPLKRLIDIIGALVGLTVLLLMIVPLSILILWDDPGPVFFWQTRCGLLCHPFRIIKFRSMVVNAEALKARIANQVAAQTHKDKESGGNNSSQDKFFKNARDPRVTKIGHFLRKSSLDEFPQFWNVLLGTMSLVGTRPPTFEELNAYELEVEYHNERFTEWNRLDVRPGITGVWQVSGRSNVKSFAEVVNFDLEYRKNWSIWYDLKLIVRTVTVLFDPKNKAV